ncbi:MAG: hypothetical protein V4613_05680 [Bacteroidota bacterium]
MSDTFYIPIQSMNLAHYLGSGIIVPSIYIENKNPDIQDRFKNYLLLSSFKFTRDTNCAIEIVLNTNEESPKKISEHFYLFNMPLPISRIKNIYFRNEEQRVSTNFNITSGSAFIPERLLKVIQEESIETKELENIDYKSSEINWGGYLKRYDQVLGGFSTMKISKENFQNYPTHYFSTLGNINSLFSKILTQQNIDIENRFKFAFTDEGKFKNFHNTIYSEINFNELQRYAESEKVRLETKNGLIQIDKILDNTQTYLVSILESYGAGKRKKNDEFISDLIAKKFVEKKKEGLSLIFGLNKGYKAFRNKYKTTNFEVDIKFHLDGKLDYYIIESIYQNVFNSVNDSSSFMYIDSLFSEVKKEENKISNYITYQMIEETIIWKQRVLTPVEKLLAKIEEIVSKWFPSFLQVKKYEIEQYFKSEIEQFKNEIECELINNHKAEIQLLNNIISEKDNSINQLDKQIKETAKSNVKNKEELAEYESIEYKVDKVNESNGSLFSSDVTFSREFELKNMSEEELKSVAKKYNITKRKPELIIAEIIKHESKK